MIAVTSGIGVASAQPCQAQFGVPNIYSPNYYSGGFQVAVPVLGTCSFEPFGTGGHLYATTTVVDVKSNLAIGTDYTTLIPAQNGYGFAGYADLTLPLGAQYDQLQFSVAVYSNQGGFSAGSLLTTASSTFLLGSSYYQGQSSYPYYPYYPYYPGYSCNYNCGYSPYPGGSYPYYPYYPPGPPSSSGYPPYSQNAQSPPYPYYPYYPGYSCNSNCGYLPPSVSASCYYPGPQVYPSYPYNPTRPC